jgi:hypothetical protein
MPTDLCFSTVSRCLSPRLVPVRPNPYAAPTNAVVSEDVAEVVEAVVASTTDVAMTTCAVTTKMEEEEEATTTVVVVAATTATRVVAPTTTAKEAATMETKVATEANKTSLHHSPTHGPHLPAAQTLFPHRHQVGSHLHSKAATKATVAMEVNLVCHPHSVQPG